MTKANEKQTSSQVNTTREDTYCVQRLDELWLLVSSVTIGRLQVLLLMPRVPVCLNSTVKLHLQQPASVTMSCVGTSVQSVQLQIVRLLSR